MQTDRWMDSVITICLFGGINNLFLTRTQMSIPLCPCVLHTGDIKISMLPKYLDRNVHEKHNTGAWPFWTTGVWLTGFMSGDH